VGDSLVTAGILAVVALSEGIRVVPPDTLVLERPHGRWRIARTYELGSGLRVVSWCIPYTLPAVLSYAPLDDLRAGATRIRERMTAVQRHVTTLRLLGAAILVLLVAGLVYAASHWSGLGLLAALALLLVLCVTQMMVTRSALLRLGEGVGVSWRLLWPFSAPRAPQLVQERALAGFPPLLVAHTLLAEDDLLRAMRREVYDLLHTDGGDSRDLFALYTHKKLEQFIATPLETEGQPYCPRCASIYRAGSTVCGDCVGVALYATRT